MHKPTRAAQIATRVVANARKPKFSGTASVQDSPCHGTSPIPEHWVDKLFARLAAIYGRRFQSTYPDSDALALAKREWAQALGRIAPELIAAALDRLVDDGMAWPPSLPEFIAMCRDSTGAPDAADAWRIVCRAIGTPGTLRQRYRHPAVLAAARHPDCDVFAWSKLPEREGLRHFAPLYRQVASRPHEWPANADDDSDGLPDFTGKAVTQHERKRSTEAARAALGEMKSMLGCAA